jgi:hypothetical protein
MQLRIGVQWIDIQIESGLEDVVRNLVIHQEKNAEAQGRDDVILRDSPP